MEEIGTVTSWASPIYTFFGDIDKKNPLSYLRNLVHLEVNINLWKMFTEGTRTLPTDNMFILMMFSEKRGGIFPTSMHSSRMRTVLLLTYPEGVSAQPGGGLPMGGGGGQTPLPRGQKE